FARNSFRGRGSGRAWFALRKQNAADQRGGRACSRSPCSASIGRAIGAASRVSSCFSERSPDPGNIDNLGGRSSLETSQRRKRQRRYGERACAVAGRRHARSEKRRGARGNGNDLRNDPKFRSIGRHLETGPANWSI